jgi:hypothetical protein
MLHALKHYSLRLWTAIVFGGAVVLSIPPLTGNGLTPASTLLPAAAILLGVFFAAGAAFTALGIRSVRSHLHGAEDWERAGSAAEAEASYRKALSAYDSFLLSPRGRKRVYRDLAEHLARFYAARIDQRAVSEEFVTAYLTLHPEDAGLAEIWLHQAGSRGWLRRRDQRLAARIGDAHPDNAAIQELLARYCLMEERTDFSALQTYHRLIESSGPDTSLDLVRRLSELFVEQGRADQWALPVYVRAAENRPAQPKLLAGIAAILQSIRTTAQNRKWIEAGRRLLENTDLDQIRPLLRHFTFSEPQPAAPAPPKRRSAQGVWRQLVLAIGIAARRTTQALLSAARRARLAVQWLKKTPAARRAILWVFFTAATVAAIVLVVNTAGYLFKSEKPPEEAAPVAKATGKFTIQVAAYLKEEHARRFAAALEQQGLDVYWTAGPVGQKQWYQVRISRFQDKDAAREFGETLKSKGLIDDFYIANYEPPQYRP